MTVTALAWVILWAAGADTSAPPVDVPDAVPGVAHYRRVNDRLATAGLPEAASLARLREAGFRTVINLRAASEPGMAEAEEAVTAAGLRYVHVPVTAATFSAADADKVAAVLDDLAAGAVLLQCGTANRAGAVWAVLQARKGATYPDAEAQGRAAGLSSDAMVAAVKRVLDQK